MQMLFITGGVVVLAWAIGGYMAQGGPLGARYQPFELVIIGGAAIGAFVISNPITVIKRTAAGFGDMMKGVPYSKENYLELLSMLYTVFKMAKSKGMLALEQHVEKPDESTLWQKFPKFAGDHHAFTFLCDYLRLLTLGRHNPHEMEALINEEIETHHAERNQVTGAVRTMADGMPALGIVAALLGVIHTIGSISEPPEVLGRLIGGALVGTFLVVLLSYGFVAPSPSSLLAHTDAAAQDILFLT